MPAHTSAAVLTLPVSKQWKLHELNDTQEILGKVLVLVVSRVRQPHGILHECKLASITSTMPPQWILH